MQAFFSQDTMTTTMTTVVQNEVLNIENNFSFLQRLCYERNILINKKMPNHHIFDGYKFDHRTAHFLQISENDDEISQAGKLLVGKELKLMQYKKQRILLEFDINKSKIHRTRGQIQQSLIECRQNSVPVALYICNDNNNSSENYIMSDDLEQIDEQFSQLSVKSYNERHVIVDLQIANNKLDETKKFIKDIKKEIDDLKQIVPPFYQEQKQRIFKKEFEILKFEFKANCLCMKCTRYHSFLHDKLL
jgi:hypothetical protein